jgi:hypothetical protein
MSLPRAPIVFLGPSARREEIAQILPTAQLAPPIARDDLWRAREQGGCIFLIIDGLFNHHLAVSPREIIDVIRDGALVLGASSMGALRGAECWPVGMRGLGVITRLYRLGWLDSDDEVAVATNPDDNFASISVALINVRFAASRALRSGLIDRQAADAIVQAAQRLYFADRRWPVILRHAGLDDKADALAYFCRNCDLKKRDALDAARVLARSLQRNPRLADDHARRDARSLARPERYPGHDRHLGMEPGELAVGLTKWLFGTGRYQPYIWSLVSGQPELHEVVETVVAAEALAETRRDALARILSRRLADITTFASELWNELDFVDELDAELMRWYAAGTLASCVSEFEPSVLQRVRDEVAIAHGVNDWTMLCEEVVDDRLFDAIPFTWIEEACLRMARARCWRSRAVRA